MRLAFLTSTPQDVVGGGGTFVSIRTLQRAVEGLGVEVKLITPRRLLPNMTLTRLLFNQELLREGWSRFDRIVGFDLDGYRIAGRTGVPHIASLKGVIADEARFEKALARLQLAIQGRCERQLVRAASKVITTSRYSAKQIQELYGIEREPVVVPESIDLSRWRAERRSSGHFAVLTVCHFYPRKRIGLLLEAFEMLRQRIPRIELRIVGSGPAAQTTAPGVTRLDQLSFDELRAEYAGADVFCLPSVQEGFGIVFLEAMAIGVPIVAARAAAVPEVVPQGVLVEPESSSALAEAIARLHDDPAERGRLRAIGFERVAQFDAPRVAAQFLETVAMA